MKTIQVSVQVANNLCICSVSAGVKTLVLLTFCDEGDNTQDALDLVSYLNTMTKWIPQNDSQVTHSALVISI